MFGAVAGVVAGFTGVGLGVWARVAIAIALMKRQAMNNLVSVRVI